VIQCQQLFNNKAKKRCQTPSKSLSQPASASVAVGLVHICFGVFYKAGGQLPCQAIVCFANTGKEDEATLRFVQDCSEHWNVPITWLEWRDTETKFEIVSFETASRNGEPFEALIRKRNYLPNPVTRFCTIDLKIRPIGRYLLSLGMAETKTEAENMSMIGMRADEQRRAAKIVDKSRIPLVTAGITKEDVGAFWREQPFDLGLPNMNGVTMHGNCDLCFLKGGAQVLSLISEKPERAIWWAKMEALALASKPSGAVFRSVPTELRLDAAIQQRPNQPF
jgi:hypothetical protein